MLKITDIRTAIFRYFCLAIELFYYRYNRASIGVKLKRKLQIQKSRD
ncbi:hypothetical protein PALI_a2805 [Pseudoalteromonas aliena SW19]|uniref:Uncharacterized protein n=1 Tax=Pseudoalteromonas aliena SW19 TaxID=1314866 RepID=A0ABR9E4I9_9GAMM|nr:hypothetical protein [Pseudoalteromonas aliena SW19]